MLPRHANTTRTNGIERSHSIGTRLSWRVDLLDPYDERWKRQLQDWERISRRSSHRPAIAEPNTWAIATESTSSNRQIVERSSLALRKKTCIAKAQLKALHPVGMLVQQIPQVGRRPVGG
jgi:hypothetical protein